jgi:N-acetylmuramoyl-L-alanine amidase CwlA
MICPAGLSNNPNRPLQSVDYITIHNTGNYNPTADARRHAEYQLGGSGGRTASWHYTADACNVWQSFEDTRECWHTGTARGNASSLGVERCVNDRDSFQAACENAAILTAEMLARYHLESDRVVQHHFWSGKNCPAELRDGKWGVTWLHFLVMVERQYRVATGHTSDEWVPSEALAEAVEILHHAGVIQSPAYWLQNAGKLDHVERLIGNMAGYVRRCG